MKIYLINYGTGKVTYHYITQIFSVVINLYVIMTTT